MAVLLLLFLRLTFDFRTTLISKRGATGGMSNLQLWHSDSIAERATQRNQQSEWVNAIRFVLLGVVPVSFWKAVGVTFLVVVFEVLDLEATNSDQQVVAALEKKPLVSDSVHLFGHSLVVTLATLVVAALQPSEMSAEELVVCSLDSGLVLYEVTWELVRKLHLELSLVLVWMLEYLLQDHILEIHGPEPMSSELGHDLFQAYESDFVLQHSCQGRAQSLGQSQHKTSTPLLLRWRFGEGVCVLMSQARCLLACPSHSASEFQLCVSEQPENSAPIPAPSDEFFFLLGQYGPIRQLLNGHQIVLLSFQVHQLLLSALGKTKSQPLLRGFSPGRKHLSVALINIYI